MRHRLKKINEQSRPEQNGNPFSDRLQFSPLDFFDALARFSPTPAWIVFQDAIVFVNSAALSILRAPDLNGILGRHPSHILENNQLRRWNGGPITVRVEEHSFELPGGSARFTSFHPVPSPIEIDLYPQMPVPVCFTDTQNVPLRCNLHFDTLRSTSPEIVTQLEPHLQKVLQTGQGVKDLEIESRDREWLVSMAPVRDAGGLLVGVNTILQNIPSEKTVEQEIHQLFRAIGESLDFGIWICDAAGRNTYSSESFCRLMGMTQEQCAGDGWAEALEPGRRALTLAAWRECVEQGRAWMAEMWLRTGEKSWQPVLTRGLPVRGAAGNIVCWAGVLFDIRDYKIGQEELEEANDKLARTNEELEAFAHTAGHDLQEPLRVIRMMTGLVKSRVSETIDLDVQTYLTTTEESAARMASLVRDLLEYARVLQPLEGSLEVSELDDAVAIAIQSCQASIEDSGAVIKVDPLPRVTANVGQIARVFQNLISNSIKYRREDPPEIAIKADRRGTEWRFSVEDNGQGISHDDHTKIFVPFKRLHSQEVPGSGLGLSVCKKIVEQHGGRIWVESQPNQGAAFCFTLPVD